MNYQRVTPLCPHRPPEIHLAGADAVLAFYITTQATASAKRLESVAVTLLHHLPGLCETAWRLVR